MGFILTAGTTAGDRQPTSRTLVDAVSRVLGSCGITRTATVENSEDHVLTALSCVNDAFERIWTAARWRWRYRWVLFDYEDKKFLYTLPGDFSAAGSTLLCMASDLPMRFIDYDVLTAQRPQLAFIPAAQQVDGGASYAGRITAFYTDNDTIGLTGLPTHWTIVGDQMGLYPLPNQDNCDSDDFSAQSHNVLGYYGSYNPVSLDTDVISLPPELLAAHHFLALAYFKQAREYPDFAVDEARGEALLKKQVARMREYDPVKEFGFKA